MNILEYIKESKKVEKLKVKFDGKDLNFYMKNLSQAEVEDMSADQTKLIPIYHKQQKGKDLSSDEMKEMLAYESDQAYGVLCDKEGQPLFKDKKTMKEKIPGRLFKAISKKIKEHNGLDDAEKN